MNTKLRVPFFAAGMILFFMCLALPAYHAYEDVPGIEALLLGPIGLFGGHFSWLANPALAAAWAMYWKKRYAAAAKIAIVALLFAGTFLLGNTIPVGSSGNFSYRALSGYYVWLASIGYTAVAAALGALCEGSESQATGTDGAGLLAKRYLMGGLLAALPAVLAIGPLVLETNKIDAAFSRLCATAGEKITNASADVEGIYLEQIGSLSFGDIHDGKYGWQSSGLTGETLVNNGFLRFYEYKAEKTSSYLRYDAVAKAQAVENILSAYSISTTKATSTAEEQLGIEGFETTIKRLENEERIASMRFFFHRKTARVCGYQDHARISETDFLARALHLKRRFPYFERGALSKP